MHNNDHSPRKRPASATDTKTSFKELRNPHKTIREFQKLALTSGVLGNAVRSSPDHNPRQFFCESTRQFF